MIPAWLVSAVRSYRGAWEQEEDEAEVGPCEALAYLDSQGMDIGDAGRALDLSGVGGDDDAALAVIVGLDLREPSPASAADVQAVTDELARQRAAAVAVAAASPPSAASRDWTDDGEHLYGRAGLGGGTGSAGCAAPRVLSAEERAKEGREWAMVLDRGPKHARPAAPQEGEVFAACEYPGLKLANGEYFYRDGAAHGPYKNRLKARIAQERTR